MYCSLKLFLFLRKTSVLLQFQKWEGVFFCVTVMCLIQQDSFLSLSIILPLGFFLHISVTSPAEFYPVSPVLPHFEMQDQLIDESFHEMAKST